jgi:hypothetical protein
MILISEQALDRLLAMETPLGRVLRLDLHGPVHVGLTFGQPRADDHVVCHKGREVVHVSAVLGEACRGAVLDVRESEDDTRLVLTRHGPAES